MANEESSAEVSPKTKNGITTCLSNSTPGYKTKTLFQKDTCNPMFTAALFTVVKICKQLKCPSNEDIYIYSYNGILLSHKKERNCAICNNRDALGGYCA